MSSYSNTTTRKNKTTKQPKQNNTKRRFVIEKLQKCPRSRITNMETYKINCGKNLLIGYNTIKASEETSIHKDDFVHVVLSRLHDYNKPVIVKVYDEDNFHLNIELNVLEQVKGFRNTAELICHFSCNDDKNKYITKIKNQIRFCGNGLDKLHFFVYEYIENGDVSDFLIKNQDVNIVISVILQITCVIIQLASIYKIYHGDINSGNILIDTINEKTIDYCIDDEIFTIENHGIIPKIIDYGRSNFYKRNISNDEVWFDIILALGIIYPYIQDNELKKKVLDISKKTDMVLPSLKEYYIYIRDNL
jgi:serine/threonine protein kinase